MASHAARPRSSASNISSFPQPDIPLPYTPTRRERPVFRNPSSVKQLQMSSPRASFSSSKTQQRYHQPSNPSFEAKRSSPSVKSGRSPTGRASQRTGTNPRAGREEFPLVLLHVTLIPLSLPYSRSTLQRVLSADVLAAHTLLQQKLNATVVGRGLLIPHPQEEYEVLEDRILEALDLRVPRILKCGHFLGGERRRRTSLCGGRGNAGGAEGSVFSEMDSGFQSGASTASGEDMDIRDHDYEHLSLEETCSSCPRQLKLPSHGAKDAHGRRWDMRVYAANGLMRDGAWCAAWREMERVDVEIGVLITDEVRARLEEEEEEERTARTAIESRTPPPRPREGSLAGLHVAHSRPSAVALATTTSAAPSRHHQSLQGGARSSRASVSRGTSAQASPTRSSLRKDPIPLSTLLKYYIIVLSQDGRNVVLFVLSTLLAFLALRSTSGSLPPVAEEVANSKSALRPALTAPFMAGTTDAAPAGATIPWIEDDSLRMLSAERAGSLGAEEHPTSLSPSPPPPSTIFITVTVTETVTETMTGGRDAGSPTVQECPLPLESSPTAANTSLGTAWMMPMLDEDDPPGAEW